jgi:hypothetical protein
MLLTSLNCEDCQNNYELADEFEKNKTNISKYECDDYTISLIKKTKNNEFEYSIIFSCKKCKNSITQIFTTKEQKYHFKCLNCKNLKGLIFNYFLSLEDYKSAKNEPIIEPKKEENIKAPPVFEQPNNNSVPENNNPFELYQNKNEYEDQKQSLLVPKHVVEKKINMPSSEINRNRNNISEIEHAPINVKSEPLKKEKQYKTPGKMINITFYKNNHKEKFEFDETDCINDKIEIIKNKINLGPNSKFYYNSEIVNPNQSFKENKIFDNCEIEIEEAEYY